MSEDLTDEQISELGQDLRSALSELEALLAAPSDRAEIVDLDQPIGRLSRMDAMQQQKMAAEQLRRHKLKRSLVRRALSSFGPGRLLYGSNYPVVGEDSVYGQELDLLLEGQFGIPSDTAEDVVGRTARKLWFDDDSAH